MTTLFLNIETVRDESVELTEEIRPPANYKDPEKIAAYILKARQEMIAEMSLSPLTGRIVCIGIADESGDVTFVTLEEVVKILAKTKRLVTFNGKQFDMPFIAVHAVLLGIKCNLSRFMYKYSNDDHIDLYNVLSVRGKGTLSQWAKRMRCVNQIYGDGSMVQDWYDAGNMSDLYKHCTSNVLATRELYNLFNGVLF